MIIFRRKVLTFGCFGQATAYTTLKNMICDKAGPVKQIVSSYTGELNYNLPAGLMGSAKPTTIISMEKLSYKNGE